MNIEIKGLDTGVTMITLTYLGKTYTTGCFFSEEVGEKVQLLVDEALKENYQDIPNHCTSCNGSGEGMYDGSTCSTCKGTGVKR